MTSPPRILLAKIGLDGHDRGVKVLARALRDGGVEVIYTGLWQTAQSAVLAAAQEDADVLGVSLLSAAHMTLVPEIVRWKREYRVERLPLVLGGIVPEADDAGLREMGVAEVFHPGSSIETILQGVKRLAAAREPIPPERLREGYRARRPEALARLLTHVARHGAAGLGDVEANRAAVVGVTGAPGVGKSSLIGKLSARLRGRGRRVAVLAVDPTSPLTGGALLGDRLRMTGERPDPEFFVRSMASGGEAGGLGPHCADAVRVLAGFGFDVVFVETVGAGQSDVAVRRLTPNCLLLVSPQSGDEIQFSKAGILEIASAVVLNKSDLPGADATAADLAAALPAGRPLWKVSTLKGEGLEAVGEWVEGLFASPR